MSYPVTGMNRVQLIWAGDKTWRDPSTVIFEWDLAHAVTVYRDGVKIDSFPVGDPTKSTTSSRHVQKVCREYPRGGQEGVNEVRQRRRPAADWRRSEAVLLRWGAYPETGNRVAGEDRNMMRSDGK